MNSNLEYLNHLNNQSENVLLFLHGYGANMHDFHPIASLLSSEFDYFFLQAPLRLHPMMNMYAWFPILEHEFGIIAKRELEDAPLKPEAIDSLNLIAGFINELNKNYANIWIGGFSQGAMMCTHLLDHPKVKGACLLSPALIGKSRLKSSLKKEEMKLKSMFVSHGYQDQVLPIDSAKKLCKMFEENLIPHQEIFFNGAHECPDEVILNLKIFLERAAKIVL